MIPIFTISLFNDMYNFIYIVGGFQGVPSKSDKKGDMVVLFPLIFYLLNSEDSVNYLPCNPGPRGRFYRCDGYSSRYRTDKRGVCLTKEGLTLVVI